MLDDEHFGTGDGDIIARYLVSFPHRLFSLTREPHRILGLIEETGAAEESSWKTAPALWLRAGLGFALGMFVTLLCVNLGSGYSVFFNWARQRMRTGSFDGVLNEYHVDH